MSGLNETPQGMRTVIAFLGRRNAGKSSLLNALVGYDLAIVSEIPGTTTDPVRKAVEIHPLGPCLVIDTAGLDDFGILGEKRIAKTKEIINDADIGLIIIGDAQWTVFEQEMLELLREENKPVIVALNKNDLSYTGITELEQKLAGSNVSCVRTAATASDGVTPLLECLQRIKNVSHIDDATILGNLMMSGELAIMVVPIDLSAPKGRLILPQVQVLRNILDENALALVVKADQLPIALANLKVDPALVITDSQVVQSVASLVPDHIPLTTFSILFSRFKGDLNSMVSGLKQLNELQDGDKILIAEACTHHALSDDIGRVKIPDWMRRYTGKKLQFEIASGPNFQKDLIDYKLVIQCGGCTISRQAYKNRISAAARQGVPITNYGLAISCMQGVLSRVIQPFKEELREEV